MAAAARQIQKRLEKLAERERELGLKLEKLAEQRRALDTEIDGLTNEHAIIRSRLDELKSAWELVKSTLTARRAKSGSTTGSWSRVPNPARSKWWEFTLRLLNDAPDEGLSLDDILVEASKQGFELQRPSVRSVLSHAVKENKIRRVDIGRFAAAHSAEQPSNHQDEGENGDSEGPGSRSQKVL